MSEASEIPLPIVLLTRAGVATGEADRHAHGVVGLVPKPLLAADLFESLQAILAMTPMRARAPGESAPRYRPLRPLRVLVAEDNVVNQRVACALLECAGHTVVIVGDGCAVVARVAAEHFDAVLMDMQMPEMDNIEATQAIRAMERAHGTTPIPIIALTAQAMRGDRETCLAAGMNAYVTKPFQAPQVLATLDMTQPLAAISASARGSADVVVDPSRREPP